jgi:hypothetical protein
MKRSSKQWRTRDKTQKSAGIMHRPEENEERSSREWRKRGEALKRENKRRSRNADGGQEMERDVRETLAIRKGSGAQMKGIKGVVVHEGKKALQEGEWTK